MNGVTRPPEEDLPRVGILEGWEIRRTRKPPSRGGAWRGAVFVVLAMLVLAVGGWFVARPTIGSAVTGLFVENPGIISIPIVSDLLRVELADRVDRPASQDATEVRFVIESGETIDEIEANLIEAGLLADPLTFRYLIVSDRVDQLIQAGTYTMTATMSPTHVVERLAGSPDPPKKVVTMSLKKGLRIEQVVAVLQKMKEGSGLKLDVKEFRDLALDPTPNLRDEYPILRVLPEGNSLEGFLGGGVWEVPTDITADELIRQMLDNWDEDRGALLAQARKKGVDFYDALRIASIVERETPQESERARVAGVYWNRLDKKTSGDTAGFLSADPTVIYAADSRALDDLPLKDWPSYFFWGALDESPADVGVPPRLASFQTYQNQGLPDWPISTPSVASLEAALEPDRKKGLLYFYACPGEDKHTFAKTLKQQQRNISKCR